jgi:hypothetical protein
VSPGLSRFDASQKVLDSRNLRLATFAWLAKKPSQLSRWETAPLHHAGLFLSTGRFERVTLPACPRSSSAEYGQRTDLARAFLREDGGFLDQSPAYTETC